jgi:hypothetical protein
MSRAQVRSQLSSFLQQATIEGLNQIFASFPNRIQFEKNAIPGQKSRAVAVVFIESENEERIALGGATSGKKRIDYQIAVQIYHHSMWDDATKTMDDFDAVIDGVKDWLRSDHRFGDDTGQLIWQGAEPAISVSYGVPKKVNSAATETWAAIRFTVTQMINA